MNDKDILICLVTGFANSCKLLEYDDTVDDDILTRTGLLIEEMSVRVFGEKIPMDFGTMHLVIDHLPEIIKYIEEFDADELTSVQ